MKKQKYYVVWKGRNTGIFTSWEECAAQVQGFADAQYKSFENIHTAQQAFRASYADYVGKTSSPLSHTKKRISGVPITDSYCVDAACSGNPGQLEYRCVHTGTRKEIFRQGPFENGTNNIGEFLGIVDALQFLNQKGSSAPIYSDSNIALLWVKGKKCKTKLVPNSNNTMLFEKIVHAESWLREYSYTSPLLKWNTAEWGEIPADYGRK